MPPILVPSSAKRIATQIFVTAKSKGRKDFILRGFVCDVIRPYTRNNYLFKVSNWNTRIKCEKCSRLRMKTLERCQWRRSRAYFVNCKHISDFLIIIGFEQAKVCWVHIEKHFWRQDQVYHGLCCSNLVSKKAFEVIPSQHYGWISEKLLRRSLLQALILPKTMRRTFKLTCYSVVFISCFL